MIFKNNKFRRYSLLDIYLKINSFEIQMLIYQLKSCLKIFSAIFLSKERTQISLDEIIIEYSSSFAYISNTNLDSIKFFTSE